MVRSKTAGAAHRYAGWFDPIVRGRDDCDEYPEIAHGIGERHVVSQQQAD